MSLKKIILLFFLSFYSFISLGQQELGEEYANSLLWKISGKDLAKPSYLFGTIHAICMEDMRFHYETIEAFQQCEQLTLELDMDEPSFYEQVQVGMLMKNNVQLEQLLIPDDYALLKQYFQDSLGVNLDLMSNIKPFFLSTLLYSKLLDCPVQSFEMQLINMAKGKNIEVKGLESVKEQLAIFDKVSYKKQAELLLQSVIELKDMQAAYWDMIVSYQNQDLNSLYHVITEVNMGMKSYEAELLNNRNRRWIPIMEHMMRKPTFFAVGAAHLIGEKGLIRLLQNRGYTVEPVFK